MIKNKKITNATEDSNFNVKDLKMKQIIPNMIDDYLVTIIDDHHTILMPPHITGMQFKLWSQGRGGIFSKDVLKHALNKNTPKYVLLKGNGIHCIARIIEEDEKPLFEGFKLIDGQIKDKPYMILRNLKNGEKLTSTIKYIEEKDIIMHETDIETSISGSEKILHDDDSDNYHPESISLFTE